MRDTISWMRWAIFFIVVDFNLGKWDIFPAFAADILYLKCLEQMKEEYPDILRLQNFCRILIVVNFVYWLVGLDIPLLSLVALLMDIYVVYTLLTFMADYGICHALRGAGNLHRYKNALVVFRVIVFAFASHMENRLLVMLIFWGMYMLLIACIWGSLSDMKNGMEL